MAAGGAEAATGDAPRPWWCDAVVYQVYPRSFQDSDGDGEGDLRRDRLPARPHRRGSGVDALWLSPIYPSPMADGGYDVADYKGVDPRFGTLDDADALIAEAHAAGCACSWTLVPCHTSIEHPWFREHPDCYVWSDVATGRRTTGSRPSAGRRGRATRATAAAGTCTPSIPSSPTSTGATPSVRAAVRRGAALLARPRRRRLPPRRDRPPAEGPAAARRPAAPTADRRCRTPPRVRALDTATPATRPTSAIALAALREAARRGAARRRGLPASATLAAATSSTSTSPSPSSSCTRRGRGAVRGRLIAAALGAGRVAWVLSNHDFPRLPPRRRSRSVRAAALLLLTLPGPVFVYQGDEIGMADGAGPEPPTTAPAATATATRCAGTTRAATAASAEGDRGCRADRSRAAQRRRPGATRRTRCCASTATSSRCGASCAGRWSRWNDAAGVLAFRRGADTSSRSTSTSARPTRRRASCCRHPSAAPGAGPARRRLVVRQPAGVAPSPPRRRRTALSVRSARAPGERRGA